MIGRPRRFSVSRLRYRITVQSHVATIGESGQRTSTWSDRLTNEPADHEDVTGGQMMRGRQIEEGVTSVFTVHYRDGYSPKQRVIYDGETYGIVRVHRVDGRKRYLELHCEGVK